MIKLWLVIAVQSRDGQEYVEAVEGSDSFTYKVNDGTSDSNEATVTITVQAIDDTPEAEDIELAVEEDTLRQLSCWGQTWIRRRSPTPSW